MLPLAMIDIKKVYKDTLRKYQQFKDKLNIGESLPQVDEGVLSFANFMHLLRERRVKRINLLGDGRFAVVELPNPGFASDYKTLKYDQNNLNVFYCDEQPEWQIEKLYFYVELPGDVWENSDFMDLIKQNIPHRSKDGLIHYNQLLREHQVNPELIIQEPIPVQFTQLSWMLNDIILIIFLSLVQFVVPPIIRLFGYVRRDKKNEAMEKLGKSRAVEYNVRKNLLAGIKDTTGVRFKDVAGLDQIKKEIEEVTKMMLGDKQYTKVGAKIPKGILMEGPPGNGKTYLAKAMAGEVALPFYSENGAQFVEMFSGIAQARVQDLFNRARKNAPSIIFIDEIDAIGGKRSETSVDQGSSEGEAGLLQLLVEMDGITTSNDQVLVVGATNRVDILDDALLRPGRFDRIIYVGNPIERNRLDILKIHAQNKVLENDQILEEAAKLTQGYSSASLANLMNEAAILTVRYNQNAINMSHILQVIERFDVGLPGRTLPDSKAKIRFAKSLAAKAVCSALTPGVPRIQYLTIRPSGSQTPGRVVFAPGNEGEELYQRQIIRVQEKVNSYVLQEPFGAFEYNVEQLQPMLVGRAYEETFYNNDEISLSQLDDLQKATEIAFWIATQSTFHPVLLDLVDFVEVTSNKEASYYLSKVLLDAAHFRALSFVSRHQEIIDDVANRLLNSPDQRMYGQEFIDIVDSYYKQEKYKQKEEPLLLSLNQEEFDQQFQGAPQDVKDSIQRYIQEQQKQQKEGQQETQEYQFNLDEILKLSLVVSGQIPVKYLFGNDASFLQAKRELTKGAMMQFTNQDRQKQMKSFATEMIPKTFPQIPNQQIINEWRSLSRAYSTFSLQDD